MDLNSALEKNRKLLLNIFLVSLGINALLGIWALLVDDFGETQGRILATSFLVSAAMVSVLVNGPAIGQRHLSPVPIAASVAGASGFLLFVVLIWGEVDNEIWLKLGFSMLIASAGGTLAGLMATAKLKPQYELLRVVNYLLIALLSSTAIIAIWAEVDSSWLGRLLGVESVLVAALTLAIPALSRFMPPPVEPDGRQPAVRFCPSCGQKVDAGLLDMPAEFTCRRCGLHIAVVVTQPI